MINGDRKGLWVVLYATVFLYGFTGLSIQDIETAIISRDYEQAKKISAELLTRADTNDRRDELNYYLGLCDLRLGEYPQSISVFKKLIGSKGKSALRDKAYLGLFEAYYLDGKYKKAQQVIKKLLKVSPRSEFLSLIYLKAARVHLKLAKWSKARKYLMKVINEYPDSLEVHVAKQLLNEEQYFSVQVGAFLEQERAEQLVQELQQKNEYAYIVETVDQNHKTFYRVRVGQLVLLDKAQKLESKLSQEGYPTRIYP